MSKTNLPSKCQAAGFIAQAELQLVRKQLSAGSKKHLLLSFYGGIPPVRIALHSTFIQMLKCKEGKDKECTYDECYSKFHSVAL